MKTHITKGGEIQHDWHVIDADGMVLGRLACEAAYLLRGKHKPNYASNLDGGDHVIIVNADKIVLTGRKLDQKFHYRHTGYPGGLKSTPYRKWLAVAPEEVIRKAVKGMLPSTRLGRAMLLKVKIYAGADHPHAAQTPKPYQVKSSRPRAAA